MGRRRPELADAEELTPATDNIHSDVLPISYPRSAGRPLFNPHQWGHSDGSCPQALLALADEVIE